MPSGPSNPHLLAELPTMSLDARSGDINVFHTCLELTQSAHHNHSSLPTDSTGVTGSDDTNSRTVDANVGEPADLPHLSRQDTSLECQRKASPGPRHSNLKERIEPAFPNITVLLFDIRKYIPGIQDAFIETEQ